MQGSESGWCLAMRLWVNLYAVTKCCRWSHTSFQAYLFCSHTWAVPVAGLATASEAIGARGSTVGTSLPYVVVPMYVSTRTKHGSIVGLLVIDCMAPFPQGHRRNILEITAQSAFQRRLLSNTKPNTLRHSSPKTRYRPK